MATQSFELRDFGDSASPWLRSMSLASVKCLVVCRGPVRKEAFDVFDEIGIREYGMLLSENDSIAHPRCLAPELRDLRFPRNVHRVPDYMGIGQKERQARIREIVKIAVDNGYTHIFAGYGFMAEGADFIEAIERAGIGFVGPSSTVVRSAGAKDEAKKLARSLGNAVIPGVDNVSARALIRVAKDREGLVKVAIDHNLEFAPDETLPLEETAEALLQIGYASAIDLVDVDALQDEAAEICREIWQQHPASRIRLKHVSGGGGKGQRVVKRSEDVETAVMEVLSESKVLPVGSNRNFLIELNIESSRHNEIQLIGNGRWCVSLGGRDCSVQMHEQKLIEVTLTRELLEKEIALTTGLVAETLRGDRTTLERMEAEAVRFGTAVGLDSVSTFECIVDGFNHFFMEINTRIQVEHTVTELIYALEFANPENPDEKFCVDRLIAAMLLLSVHGERLPEPRRISRETAAVEVRINATNQALQPHAGAVLRNWSKPIDGEIRYDQGIGRRNPDTGAFVNYNLAGAYDSNIALVVVAGEDRRRSYERIAEILRRMDIRGDDLQTNHSVHYGLINWFLGKGPMAEPDTRFVRSYLAGVGALQRVVEGIDLEVAQKELLRREVDADARAAMAQKQTLLKRPIERLFSDPHLLAGFIGRFEGVLWGIEEGEVRFAANPVHCLRELYHYLDLEHVDDKPPSERIWEHDEMILSAGVEFYERVTELTGVAEWSEVQHLLGGERDDRIARGDDRLWEACRASHRGFQVDLELLLMIPRVGVLAGFSEIYVDDQLRVVFPERFSDPESVLECTKALEPPAVVGTDEIVTVMGGTFFSREAPNLPAMVEVGDHVVAGQPLFIIEVMKMFNKVLAPFSGTITERLMADLDGTVVAKGAPIFRIDPDERREEESEDVRRARVHASTLALL